MSQNETSERMGKAIQHLLTLALGLLILWLLLSGIYEPLLLALGLASCLLVTAIAHRMEVVDHESVPLQLRFMTLSFWAWLAKEIFKSNIAVTGIILSPRMPISPCLVTRKGEPRTELGKTIYANSITLTPGTVTIEVEGDTFFVHALTKQSGSPESLAAIGRWVARMEG